MAFNLMRFNLAPFNRQAKKKQIKIEQYDNIYIDLGTNANIINIIESIDSLSIALSINTPLIVYGLENTDIIKIELKAPFLNFIGNISTYDTINTELNTNGQIGLTLPTYDANYTSLTGITYIMQRIENKEQYNVNIKQSKANILNGIALNDSINIALNSKIIDVLKILIALQDKSNTNLFNTNANISITLSTTDEQTTSINNSAIYCITLSTNDSINNTLDSSIAIISINLETSEYHITFLDADATLQQVEYINISINTLIKPGETITIDSQNFDVTVDGKNRISSHSGDWLILNRDVASIDLSIPESQIIANLGYEEKYL